MNAPKVEDVTLMAIEQLPLAGIVALTKPIEVLPAVAFIVPEPQPVNTASAGLAIVTPAGKLSVKAALVKAVKKEL